MQSRKKIAASPYAHILSALCNLSFSPNKPLLPAFVESEDRFPPLGPVFQPFGQSGARTAVCRCVSALFPSYLLISFAYVPRIYLTRRPSDRNPFLDGLAQVVPSVSFISSIYNRHRRVAVIKNGIE